MNTQNTDNTANKPLFFRFLHSPLGLGYALWKSQARSVKLDHRLWRKLKQFNQANKPL
ncbi:hypothetical protein [Thiomicrospira microaerophila]|uniref:hypothetical protein n=1 Tax=Thiomicrospira microaerophila TaxID=406020 RepID=UPI0012FD5CE2|nr:hypothetical protein [Thiomicrospira microaerophila]